jgi:hypothetical protein
MKRSTGFLPGCLAASLAFSPVVLAQWDQYTVTVIDLHPEGASASSGYEAAAAQVAGTATISGRMHAALWLGGPEAWVDLHPPGGSVSRAYGTTGAQQAGVVFIGTSGSGIAHAAVWSGTADSWVDLHPSAATDSYAWAAAEGQQAGYATVAGRRGACVWSGTAGSWVDLHPPAYRSSEAKATAMGQQAGVALVLGKGNRAGLWVGTPESWVDLNPAGAASSVALATSGTQQAGYAGVHAGIWAGTAGSWVDLHPSAAGSSRVEAVSGGLQAGWATFGDALGPVDQISHHASLWFGTAASWLDLHSFLGSGYGRFSYAYGVWTDGRVIHVVGNASDHAILWRLVRAGSPPALSEIPPQTTSQDGIISNVRFSVSDADTPVRQLTVRAGSSNPWLVAPTGLAIQGTRTDRTLKITPEPNRFGETYVTLLVSDGVSTGERTFKVTVTSLEPVISEIPTQTTYENAPILGIPFTVSDPDTPAAELEFTIASSHPALVSPQGVVVRGVDTNRTLDITPEQGQFGETQITLTVNDGRYHVSRSFQVTVVSLGPVISEIPAQNTLENRPILGLEFMVSDPDTPLADLILAADSANPALIGPSGLVLDGAGANRTLDITPEPGQFGEAMVTLVAKDATHTTTQTFLVTVISSGPTISQIPVQTTLEETAILDVPFTVGDPDTPVEDLALSVASSNPTLIIPANVAVKGTGAQRSLDLAPQAAQSGEAWLTLTASDGNRAVSTTFRLKVAPGSLRWDQYAVAVTHLGPAGSRAWAVRNHQQAGEAGGHAGYWLATPGSWVDLHPSGVSGPSVVYATVGSQQAGVVGGHAGVWSGTADSWTDLHPPGMDGSSVVHATTGTRQVGEIRGHAALWSGTADSLVDLHPAGAVRSAAHAMNSVMQGGEVMVQGLDDPEDDWDVDTGLHAALWNGSSASWVDLHPGPNQSYYSSKVLAMTETRQGGYLASHYDDYWGSKAGIWSGTADSWIDLGPATTVESAVLGMAGELQVGYAGEETDFRAFLWAGSNDSWCDLHPTLGYRWGASWATAIWQSADTISICGYAEGEVEPGVFVEKHAVLWTLALTKPRVSEIPPQATVENRPLENVAFSVSDRDTPLELLTFTVESSNPDLIPARGVLIQGSGASRTLTLTPEPDRVGEALITVIASDGTHTGRRSFQVTVISSGPEISPIPPQHTLENTPILNIIFTVSDPDTPLDDLVFGAASSNPTLIDPSAVVIRGGGAHRSLDITPERQRVGEALITVTAHDGAKEGSRTFRVTVTPRYAVVAHDLHPANATSSRINGIAANQQAGWARIGGVARAGIWSGTAASWQDLSGGSYSHLSCTTGTRQMGDHTDKAATWSGTASSVHRIVGAGGIQRSSILATAGEQHVGYAVFYDASIRAMAWTGPSDTQINLHPGGIQSVAEATIGSRQGGYVWTDQRRASLWSGTADSWMDLHPAGSRSSAVHAMAGDLQGGEAWFGDYPGASHAGLWAGTADSWLDLHPAGMKSSIITAMIGSHQVGMVHAGGAYQGESLYRASLWSGTAGSWFDLHRFLPPDFISSQAQALWTDGSTTLVGGRAKTSGGEDHALLWVLLRQTNSPPVASADTVERRAGASVKVAVSRLLANDTDADLDPLSLTAVAPLSEKQAAVSLSGDWVLYVPPPGLSESDTFTYTVSDGHGGEATGTVTVLVTDEPAGPSPNQLALNVTRDPDTGEITGLTLTFVGIPARLYALERAATLEPPVTWTCLETQTAGPTGLMEFTDSQPLAGEAYYRTAERTTPCP